MFIILDIRSRRSDGREWLWLRTMKPLESESKTPPIARVYFAGGSSPYPGWFLQRYVGPDLVTIRLPLVAGADAFEAVTFVANHLACAPERVQIEGPRWSRQTPLDEDRVGLNMIR